MNNPKVPYEVKVQNDRVYLFGSSGWSRPVVDDKGTFFRSIVEASQSHRITPPTACKYADRGEGLYWASLTLVQAFIEKENKIERAREALLKKHQVSDLTQIGTVTKPEVIVPVVPKPQHPFVGIEWPDLTVTVRLSTGGTWTLTRAKQADVPDEIRNHCAWGKL
jgi:hypothetical protein